MAIVAIAGLLTFFVEMKRRWDRPPHLRAGNGPFLVLARVFRGPEAEAFAERLATELRSEHALPAYLHQMPSRPSRAGSRGPGVGGVAVFVGDAPSIDEAERLMIRLKRIRPKSLGDMPGMEATLRRAVVTQNPAFVAR